MTITYRKGTIEDSYAVFQVFVKSIMDYSERMNVMGITGGNGPEVLKSLWQRCRPMFEFLTKDAAQFWFAEAESILQIGAHTLTAAGSKRTGDSTESPVFI